MSYSTKLFRSLLVLLSVFSSLALVGQKTAQVKFIKSPDKTEVFTLVPVKALTVYSKSRPQPSGDNLVELLSISYKNFSRGLLQFDFSPLKSAGFDRIHKAFLTAKIKTNKNPHKIPLELGAFLTDWNNKISFWHSGVTDYPKDKNRSKNIDYAVDKNTLVKIPVAEDSKELSLDVTDLINGFVYEGKTGNSILLKMGKTIHGIPKAINFDLVLTDIKLVVTMSGEAPSIADVRKRSIRFFPSALLTPVRDPYIFHLFLSPVPEVGPSGYSVINSAGKMARPERGILKLNWFFGPNNPWIKKGQLQKFIDGYVNAAKNPKNMGIEVDEWQGTKRVGKKVGGKEDPNRVLSNEKIEYSRRGIIEANKIDPSFYVAVYWRGEDSIKELTDIGLPHLLIIEGQSHLNKKFPKSWGIGTSGVLKRAAFAKSLGMIERSIILIGFFLPKEKYHHDMILTEKDIESKIKLFRQKFPEMPGVAFYGAKNPKLFDKAQEICYKEFIAPAPVLKLNAPYYNQKINSTKFVVSAEAKGKDGRTIQRYDYYVDNRLVAQSSSCKFLWDTRDVEKGQHIITVHAIDSKWNRSSVQIPVVVK